MAVLRALLADERRKSDALLEASLVWQTRAMQLQERLAALEACPIAVAESNESADAPQDATDSPLQGETRSRTREAAFDEAPWPPIPASDSTALRWRRWLRRIIGNG